MVKESAAHSSGASEEQLAKNLRKFVSGHQTLLSWAAFQALQLRRIPAHIRTMALHVDLEYRPNADPARRCVSFSYSFRAFDLLIRLSSFVVSSARLVSRAVVESYDPLVAEDIARRESRCRRSGGIGCAVVLIQCGPTSQVMPVECDSPARIGWDTREDWQAILERYIEAGRTDFQPITTTSRGYVQVPPSLASVMTLMMCMGAVLIASSSLVFRVIYG